MRGRNCYTMLVILLFFTRILPNNFSNLILKLGSLIRPKVVRSVHYCPATKKVMERKYADLTSLEAFPTSSVYPTKV